MAQLVLTVVGYYIAGPVGGAIGAAIGGAIDQSMAPDLPTVEGPRLADKKVQVSAYGAAVGYSYGTTRLSGNVIWAQDLEEVATETEVDVGGKGGGPSQTSIAYSYFGTFAILLAYGEQRGIRRIWGDAVMIYDSTRVESMLGDAYHTFYAGTEEQLTDPTVEADVGVSLTPAYRGYAYIVFNRLPLEAFGNRIPNITVEMVGDGEWSSEQTALGATSAIRNDGAVQRLDGTVITVGETLDSPSMTRLSELDPSTGAVVRYVDTAIGLDSDAVLASWGAVAYIPPLDEVWVSQGAGIERYGASSLVHVGSIATPWDVAMAYEPQTRRIIANIRQTIVSSEIFTIGLDGDRSAQGDGEFGRQVVVGGSVVFLVCGGSNRFSFYEVHGVPDIFTIPAPLFIGYHITFGTQTLGTWDSRRRRYVVAGADNPGGGGALWLVTDANPPTITMVKPAGMYYHSAIQEFQYIPGIDAYVAWSSPGGTAVVTVIDAESLEVLEQNTGVGTLGVTRVFQSVEDAGYVFAVGSYRPYLVRLFGTTVGAVVSDLCLRSDELEPGDIDVAELTQRLRGYLVARQGAARGAITPLSQAYFFDGVEIDDQIYFRRRGGAAVATITRDECGAGVDDRAEVALETTRAQELDLPRRLFLTAPDPAADQQPGTQYAERQARRAGEDESIQTAVVMTTTECRRTALTLLFDRWASRFRQPFAVDRKYSRLVPSDPITLAGRRMRIVSRSDEGGLLRFEAVADDAEVFDQTAVGVQGEFPGQSVAVQVPTNLVILDTALLRDSEDYPGTYIAGYGIAPQWKGGVVYTSSDEGDTWGRAAVLLKPGSSVGVATDVLGNWPGPNIFDESNSINVDMRNGAPSSATRLAVLNGGNAAAVRSGAGWEVIQYRDVTAESDGTYTLSGLLRGRRGTEWAMAGHAEGDVVVLLNTATIEDYEIDSSVIGVERPYKAVTIGDTIAGTAAVAATITAERLMPLAPVLLGGGRNAGLEVLLKWVRRTRVGGAWRDSVDASLGESTEEYVVKVYSSASYTTLKRTISSLTSQSTTYAAADQVTDFGSTQSAVYWTVQQLSATVGAGHIAYGIT